MITRCPDWEPKLAGLHVEGAWMVGDWEGVQALVQHMPSSTPEWTIATLLLAIRAGSRAEISNAFSAARTVLGAPITAAGRQSYRRCYDSIVNLHVVHELQAIHEAGITFSNYEVGSLDASRLWANLKTVLASRLDRTLPTFKAREPILSMRRTAFLLRYVCIRIWLLWTLRVDS